jgi:hypothetical protein
MHVFVLFTRFGGINWDVGADQCRLLVVSEKTEKGLFLCCYFSEKRLDFSGKWDFGLTEADIGHIKYSILNSNRPMVSLKVKIQKGKR